MFINYIAFSNIDPTDAKTLKAVGFSSKSAIINISSSIMIFLVIFVLHMIIKFWFNHFSQPEHKNRWMRLSSKLKLKLHDLVFYFAYARAALESYENVLMSSTVELYANETHTVISKASHIFSWIIFISCFIFTGFLVYLCYKFRNKYIPKKKHLWMEAFSGIRNSKWARIYTAGVILKSTFYIIVVLILKDVVPRNLLFSIIIIFQTSYCFYVVRYYKFFLISCKFYLKLTVLALSYSFKKGILFMNN